MELFEKCRSFTAARDAREQGVYPYFRPVEENDGGVVVMEGKPRIMLGSNNYLGLTIDPRVKKAAADAALKYGSGCSGSRFLNGTFEMHRELERELANFLQKEAVVTFSTGFMANLGIISAICGRGDYIFSDRENHASIYDGCKLSYAKMIRYKHGDMEDLERHLAAVPENAGKLIVTDGVFSMGGDICDLPSLVRLKEKYGARLMVDDAHSLGVLGERGRGTAEYFGLTDKVDIIMGTFSKSLASLGGYMAADEFVVDYVRHVSRPFIFCASIPPANAAAALAALRIIENEPELPASLLRKANYVRSGLKARGIPIRESLTPIVPIYTYDPETTLKAAKALYEAGVYVNTVLPPATSPNECLLRTSYMAIHTEEVLDEAMDIIKAVMEKGFE